AMQANGLANFGHRKPGVGGALEALSPRGGSVVSSGLGALESRLRPASLAAGFLLLGVEHRDHPKSWPQFTEAPSPRSQPPSVQARRPEPVACGLAGSSVVREQPSYRRSLG